MLHKDSSNNLLHHAYNLLQLDLHTPLHKLPTILEFGGGYGSTARLAFRLGFQGTYLIFDLPEFSALQRFYLSTLNFPVAPAAKNNPAIHCISLNSTRTPKATPPKQSRVIPGHLVA